MDSFIYSLNATVPVFAIMILGYLLKQWNIIDDHFAQVSNKFVFKICLPCMVFQDLADTDIRHHFDLDYIGFCFFATLVSILAIWILTRRLMPDPHMTGAFVQGAYRSSAAILGVAFIQNIYGTSSMAPLMMIGSVPLYNIFAVLILTLENNHSTNGLDALDNQGITANVPKSGQIKSACIEVAKNPIIIGIVLGLAASYLNLDFPNMVDKSIHNLAVLASPLALIAIGATCEGRNAIANRNQTINASSLKLVVLAAIYLPEAIWLG
ncbi:MAG: AEC family transporter, partial [Lachnospiraceae bacterium]|nr:AEC family transporter [Lachnospiraceae bacterium]